MSEAFLLIAVILSVILGTIAFQFINKTLNVTYFGFQRIFVVWGTCVLITFMAILGVCEGLGILDFVTQ